jgi:hypothetical protein
MADSTSAAQQQYPNLNPYSSTNGNANGSLENAKNTVINSEVRRETWHICTRHHWDIFTDMLMTTGNHIESACCLAKSHH